MANTIKTPNKMPKCKKCDSNTHWMRMDDKIKREYYWECFNWIVTDKGSLVTDEQLCCAKITNEERRAWLALFRFS